MVLREQNKSEVVTFISGLLLALSELYSLEKFGAQNAVLVAEWIVEEYKFDQLEVVTRVLRNPPPTEDKVWKLNPDTIREWMSIELERQADKREKEINNAKHLEAPSIWAGEHDEQRLKELAENLKKVDDFKVPSLSEEDVVREGQERVVKTYHSPDKSYLKELELKVEYGRLHTDLHSGKPKEGAPTYTEWLKTAK